MADGGLLAEARIPREELNAGNKRRQLLVGAAKPPAKPVEITDKRSWGTLHQNRTGYLIIRRVPVTVPRQMDQYAFITNYNLHHSLQIF